MSGRGALRNCAEYAAAGMGAFFVDLLPFSWATGLGAAMGAVAHRLLRGRRELAVRQAGERLGLDEPAARRLVGENFRHYGKVAAELCRLAKISDREYDRRTAYGETLKLARELLAEKKGLLFVTAHHGNWEWANAWPKANGLGGVCIARPLDNPLLDGWLRRVRERRGLRVIDKAGALRAALKALRNNGIVGILIDQDAGPRGLMSPFLGKPASTETLPVELAVRLGTPMLAVAAVRAPGAASAFTLRLAGGVVRARPGADPAREVPRLTDELNARLGQLIREAPEQWFWVHRRWKTRSPAAGGE
ncbi:MAG: lysophospholipid acyltransferase family protein [Planctomycetota bacterium]|nr:lysophospholipid acyltransferase family protein [Planctomycetota bacterium]